jgi:hypothetical protein
MHTSNQHMSKNSTTAVSGGTKQGDKFTPKTTLNADMLAKHKLRGNSVDPQRYISFRNDKKVRDFSRMISTYRVLCHGVVTNHRLASPLRSMAHYFAIPITRGESNERRETPVATEAAATA